jgi:hypothetical protein
MLTNPKKAKESARLCGTFLAAANIVLVLRIYIIMHRVSF